MSDGGATLVQAPRCASVVIDPLDDPRCWPILEDARLAALADASEAFVASLADELQRSPEQWAALVARSTWVVARDGGEVVGLASLTCDDWCAAHERFIESVWVEPGHRRQGLVRQMLRALEAHARADGATLLQLWVLETNSVAFDAYLKLGFEEVPDRLQNSEKRVGGSVVRERLMVKQLW